MRQLHRDLTLSSKRAAGSGQQSHDVSLMAAGSAVLLVGCLHMRWLTGRRLRSDCSLHTHEACQPPVIERNIDGFLLCSRRGDSPPWAPLQERNSGSKPNDDRSPTRSCCRPSRVGGNPDEFSGSFGRDAYGRGSRPTPHSKAPAPRVGSAHDEDVVHG